MSKYYAHLTDAGLLAYNWIAMRGLQRVKSDLLLNTRFIHY